MHGIVLLFSNSLVLPLLAGVVDGKPFSSAVFCGSEQIIPLLFPNNTKATVFSFFLSFLKRSEKWVNKHTIVHHSKLVKEIDVKMLS